MSLGRALWLAGCSLVFASCSYYSKVATHSTSSVAATVDQKETVRSLKRLSGQPLDQLAYLLEVTDQARLALAGDPDGTSIAARTTQELSEHLSNPNGGGVEAMATNLVEGSGGKDGEEP